MLAKMYTDNGLPQNVEYPGFYWSFKTCRSGVLIVTLKSKKTKLFIIYILYKFI